MTITDLKKVLFVSSVSVIAAFGLSACGDDDKGQQAPAATEEPAGSGSGDASSVMDDAKEEAGEMIDDAKEEAGEMIDDAEEEAGEMMDEAEEDIEQKADEAMDEAKKKADELKKKMPD